MANLKVTIERNGRTQILVMNARDFYASTKSIHLNTPLEHIVLPLSGRNWIVVSAVLNY